MKILVTGGHGLVGSHFVQNSSNLNDTILSPTQEELDITDLNSVMNFFKLQSPDAVVHFAAFTDVSVAEEQKNNKKAPCWIINVEGTANLVKAASQNHMYFIHISTDVVFSGLASNPGPYPENHPPEEDSNSLSWYGWTKKEAEKIVRNNLQDASIVRIANPVRAKYSQKLDYVRKILKAFDDNKLYPMFSDQYLTLTYIDEVTESLKILLENKLSGIFHVSSTNIFTPFKLANYLIEKARGKKEAVQPNSIKKFLKNNPSRYLQYGGLKVDKTQNLVNLKFKTWEEIIDSLVKQLSA